MAGKYVEFDILQNGNLRITLLPEAREDVQEISASQELDADNKLAEVVHWQLGNGWSFLTPEQAGGLTDSPIFSEDVETDDKGEITHVGVVYWYPQYAIKDPVAELLEEGSIDFERVE